MRLLRAISPASDRLAPCKGNKAHILLFGDIHLLIAELGRKGLETLISAVVKASKDPVSIKEKLDASLVFQGGRKVMNIVQTEKVEAEIIQKPPILKVDGEVIFSSNHIFPLVFACQLSENRRPS